MDDKPTRYTISSDAHEKEQDYDKRKRMGLNVITSKRPSEQKPLQKQKDSVKKYERPTDPAIGLDVWEAWFKSGGVSDDFMKTRDQPSNPKSR